MSITNPTIRISDTEVDKARDDQSRKLKNQKRNERKAAKKRTAEGVNEATKEMQTVSVSSGKDGSEKIVNEEESNSGSGERATASESMDVDRPGTSASFAADAAASAAKRAGSKSREGEAPAKQSKKA